MATPLIIEAFDEGERRMARLGLCLEPAAGEKLALERGEEALAHGIVQYASPTRTHRGAHARITAAASRSPPAARGSPARCGATRSANTCRPAPACRRPGASAG